MKTSPQLFQQCAKAFALAFALFANNASAEVTPLVNYQGKLKHAGTNAHGPINVTFKVFTGDTNTECVYEESQQVNVVDGLYSTLIGQNPTLGTIEDATMLDDAFLEVAVNGTCLKPREKFTPPPFARKTEESWTLYGGINNPVSTVNPLSTVYDVRNALSSFGATYRYNIGGGGHRAAVFPLPRRPVVLSSASVFVVDSAFSGAPEGQITFVLKAWDLVGQHRQIGTPLSLSITNPPFRTWIAFDLGTNNAAKKLNPSDFLYIDIGMSVGTGAVPYPMFDICVK